MSAPALVTGAAHGIGRAAAVALDRGRHDVAIHYRRSRREAEAVRSEAEVLVTGQVLEIAGGWNL